MHEFPLVHKIHKFDHAVNVLIVYETYIIMSSWKISWPLNIGCTLYMVNTKTYIYRAETNTSITAYTFYSDLISSSNDDVLRLIAMKRSLWSLIQGGEELDWGSWQKKSINRMFSPADKADKSKLGEKWIFFETGKLLVLCIPHRHHCQHWQWDGGQKQKIKGGTGKVVSMCLQI